MAKKKANVKDYKHQEQRKNIPEAGLGFQETVKQKVKKYQYDPNLEPSLNWTGKSENSSFDVETISLHIHERISTKAIIRAVERRELQRDMFNDPDLPLSKKLEFYQHDVDWSNRVILGDSLVVMNSLLEKELMAGKVQCIFFDPPYGIDYKSNFQPFINSKSVKSDDNSLSREEAQICAYRDTWHLGIHSFLTYMKDRLLLSRELLSESGSIFLQISDKNLHYVRILLDEVFGAENFIALIPFRKKTMPFGTNYIEQMSDFIIWYGKEKYSQNKSKIAKYNKLFKKKSYEGDFHWCWYEQGDGSRHKMTQEQIDNNKLVPSKTRIYRLKSLEPSGRMDTGMYKYTFNGKVIDHPKNGFGVNIEGMKKLEEADRLQIEGSRLTFIMYADENEYAILTAPWEDTVGADNKIYTVQTNTEVVKRCLLMTTDPGDIVLDPTCGSGTTAFVAEKFGRRWITCDTSRVAVNLAKQRLMTAVYPYYQLVDDDIKYGLKYKEFLYHPTVKTITNNIDPGKVVLYDDPIINKKLTRVTGPFTFEMLPTYSENSNVNDKSKVVDEDNWFQRPKSCPPKA